MHDVPFAAGEFSLTLHEAQLNHGDQLAQWERLGLLRADAVAFSRERAQIEKLAAPAAAEPGQRNPVLSALLPRAPEHLRRFAAANDAHASLDARARSYLGVNCAHCHTLYGGGNSAMDFDWLLPPDEMHALGEPAKHGDFGLTAARVITPGAAARSVVIPRVSLRGPGQMPPLGTRIADPDGVRLLAEWIESLRK